jgi:23S rRNA (pseudouridine1915-N3)-methyltransferase
MRFVIAVVGRPRDAGLASAIQEYEARAARYWPLEVHEVKDEPARGIAALVVAQRESARLADRVGSARLVACDAAGTQMTSPAFANWLQEARERARDVAFLIGGAFGLAPELKQRADLLLSFASWTLPHELARLVLAEQLYRAGTIVRGEPYHK